MKIQTGPRERINNEASPVIKDSVSILKVDQDRLTDTFLFFSPKRTL